MSQNAVASISGRSLYNESMAKKKNKDKTEARPKKYILVTKRIGLISGAIVLSLFLLLNVAASQDMPPIYESLVTEQDGSLVSFLKTGKTVPEFKSLYPELRTLFRIHKDDIYAEDLTRRETILKLEALRVENPQSTEVLYSLYLLYQKDGDELKAQEALHQAQLLDPQLH